MHHAIDTQKSAVSLRDLEKFKMTTKEHRGCDSGNKLSLDDLHAHTVPLSRLKTMKLSVVNVTSSCATCEKPLEMTVALTLRQLSCRAGNCAGGGGRITFPDQLLTGHGCRIEKKTKEKHI